MRLGPIVERTHREPHLEENKKYIIVYPSGTEEDLRTMFSLPLGSVKHSEQHPLEGQSPLYVELNAWMNRK